MKLLIKYKRLLVFLIFIIVSAYNIFNHILWRDEFHSLLITLEANSFSELLTNRINEGHPIGWYLVIKLIGVFSSSIFSYKLFILVITSISAYFIIYKSSFIFYQKVVLCFGYYFLFEYSVFIRPYGLSLMVFLAILILSKKFHKNYIWISILLMMLLNIQAHVSILAGTLFIYFVVKNNSHSPLSTKETLLFMLFPVAGVLFFIVDLSLLQNLSWVGQSDIPQIKEHKGLIWFLQNIGKIQEGILPIPNLYGNSLWNSTWIERIASINTLKFSIFSSIFSVILTALIIKTHKKHILELGFLLISFFLLTVFIAFFFQGQQRHFGFYFIVFLIFNWLIYEKKEINSSNLLFSSVIIINLIAGAFFIVKTNFESPFSNSKSVTDFIEKKYQTSFIISGVPDYTLEPISGYLGQPFYNFQKLEMNSFIKWGGRDDFLDYLEFINGLESFKNIEPDKLHLVILSIPYYEYIIKNKPSQLRFVQKFENAIVEDENYLLFELE